MFMTFKDLQECIQKAEENAACEYEITIIKELNSIEEFFNHPKCLYWLYWYTTKVIKGRWLEAEEVIKTDPEYSYWYSRDVIKGRWTEAEEVIKTDPEFSYRYAKDVMGGS